jgi:hypothetical protein
VPPRPHTPSALASGNPVQRFGATASRHARSTRAPSWVRRHPCHPSSVTRDAAGFLEVHRQSARRCATRPRLTLEGTAQIGAISPTQTDTRQQPMGDPLTRPVHQRLAPVRAVATLSSSTSCGYGDHLTDSSIRHGAVASPVVARSRERSPRPQIARSLLPAGWPSATVDVAHGGVSAGLVARECGVWRALAFGR